MPYVEINGTQLYYERAGKGPTVLTFHGGLGMDHIHVKYETEALLDKFEFIYFDFRANGRSINKDKPEESESFTYEQLIDDAEELRKKLRLGKVYLYGKSLGCFLALLYATKYQDNLIKMITSCGMAHFEHDWTENMEAADERMPEHAKYVNENSIEEPKTPEEETKNLELGFFRYYFDYSEKYSDFTKKLVKESIMHLPTLKRDVELRQTTNILEKINKIKVETLVIGGEFDIIPLKNLIDIDENLPNSKLVVFDKSGHFPSQEEPEKFNKIVSEFLSN